MRPPRGEDDAESDGDDSFLDTKHNICPLLAAVGAGDILTALSMLEANADVNTTSEDGTSLALLASRKSNSDLLQEGK